MNKGYSIAMLKYIAMICMLCDHIGMLFFEPFAGKSALFGEVFDVPLRTLGRWSFPLFLFCLIQGYFHTHNKVAYAKRLLIAAVLAEIPYDFGTTGHCFVWTQNNIMWTMGMIVFMCLLYDKAREQKELCVRICYCGIIWSVFAWLAYFTHVEYGFAAITAATVLYFYREKQTFGYGLSLLVLTILFSPVEALALPTVLLIHFYNQQKGKQFKYLFYVFYPLHLVILQIIHICLS